MRDWKQWFKAAGIRAIKTMAQAAIGVISAAALITDVNWWVVLSASIMSGIASLLTSIAGLPELQTIEVNYITSEKEGENDDI